MPDLLDKVRSEVDERLAELRPMVEEARRLEAALAALDSQQPPPRVRRRRSRPAGAPRRGRPASRE
jgi:hypothetical protein